MKPSGNRLPNAKLKDIFQSSVHSRQTFIRKKPRYAREGCILECEYSPVSEGIKHMSVNGKPIEQPKLKITGFDTSQLPFMD